MLQQPTTHETAPSIINLLTHPAGLLSDNHTWGAATSTYSPDVLHSDVGDLLIEQVSMSRRAHTAVQ